ncbi:MAG TPA: AtpZ/AtpI family protein [Kiloniellaceae bacterium]|nr:AtpZ/AtpI family protein [Kiloniellaceae bacterium]
MTRAPGNGERDALQHAVRLREARRRRWDEEGERSLWQNLSMIGALGWLIVTPILMGIAIGRWLDRTFETGIFFSGAFIFLGVVLGAGLAWQRIHKE